MRGLMSDEPLLISSISKYAETVFPDVEVVSVTADQGRHRSNYRECFGRARRLAGALEALGVKSAQRIGTLGWSDHRHFEAYHAISCSGAICHTINPRLFDDQLVYIINHPKWAERPLLVVVRAEGADIDRAAVLGWFEGKVAKWWTPDDVVFVDVLPHTATGKIKKTTLRERFADHYRNAASSA